MQKTSDILWQDTQHQVLFELIEAIKQQPFDYDILIRLQLYAEHHFVLEEAYMEALNYPGREAHLRAHGRFRVELASMMNIDTTMTQLLQDTLSKFLYHWLKLHVLSIDKELEDFILRSKLK
jgi:hemerythrin